MTLVAVGNMVCRALEAARDAGRGGHRGALCWTCTRSSHSTSRRCGIAARGHRLHGHGRGSQRDRRPGRSGGRGAGRVNGPCRWSGWACKTCSPSRANGPSCWSTTGSTASEYRRGGPQGDAAARQREPGRLSMGTSRRLRRSGSDCDGRRPRHRQGGRPGLCRRRARVWRWSPVPQRRSGRLRQRSRRWAAVRLAVQADVTLPAGRGAHGGGRCWHVLARSDILFNAAGQRAVAPSDELPVRRLAAGPRCQPDRELPVQPGVCSSR